VEWNKREKRAERKRYKMRQRDENKAETGKLYTVQPKAESLPRDSEKSGKTSNASLVMAN
jgi:hypothetical protein